MAMSHRMLHRAEGAAAAVSRRGSVGVSAPLHLRHSLAPHPTTQYQRPVLVAQSAEGGSSSSSSSSSTSAPRREGGSREGGGGGGRGRSSSGGRGRSSGRGTGRGSSRGGGGRGGRGGGRGGGGRGRGGDRTSAPRERRIEETRYVDSDGVELPPPPSVLLQKEFAALHPEASSARRERAVSATAPVAVGDELELECARLALEGKGVCLMQPSGFVVLVERTLPGEHVRAEVTSVRKGHAEARKLETLAPHRHAVAPPCTYFGPCGGCTLQSLAYEAQLAEKRNQVEQTLRRVGRLGPSLDRLAAEAGEAAGGSQPAVSGVAPTVGCAAPLAYRNKMMFHFSSRFWLPPDNVVDRNALGLLRPGTPDVVLPVTQHGCQLQDKTANAMLLRVEQWVAGAGIMPYNHKSGKGFLKHLVIRSGSGMPGAATAQQEYMLVFGVTQGSAAPQLQPLAEALAREFPQLVSVVSQVTAPPKPSPRDLPPKEPERRDSRGRDRRDRNDRGRDRRPPPPPPSDELEEEEEGGGDSLTGFAAGAAPADKGALTVLYGKPYIHDTLGDLVFRISPGSFFQTNSGQAATLYDVVRKAAALRPGRVDTLVDLYCGTGTIGLSLAPECRAVLGVESVESAVEDARLNAALNGITNATFARGNVDKLDQLEEPGLVSPGPDVVVVDPARGGLSPEAAAWLGRCGARRVVYVSCNVATQARDLDRLCNGPGAAFRLVAITPVDMFPHTDHVETVAVLEALRPRA